MFPVRQLDLAERVLARCRQLGLRLATAESCTGGLVSACLTAVAGSSDVLERGFVCYHNDAKVDLLCVDPHLLAESGAVSEAVARAMAEGALNRAPVDAAVAVTGVAGPGGGTGMKPVGLVHVATARVGRRTRHRQHVFPGDRTAIRAASVDAALDLLLSSLD